MKQIWSLERKSKMIGLASDITYMQKTYWCHCSARALKMSFMSPRQHYTNDGTGEYPLIVFVCGGGWEKVDRNAWLPNLVYFVERGYAVASVDYSVLPYTEFPEPMMEIKAAIRFIRAHAKEFHILPEKIAVMGESAGAYLADFIALTGDDPQYRDAHNPEESDAVNACVSWYVPSATRDLTDIGLRVRVDNYPDLCDLVKKDSPPVLLFHGIGDTLIPYSQSERLYERLQEEKVVSELYLIEGADHADALFVQEEVKQKILEFLDRCL